MAKSGFLVGGNKVSHTRHPWLIRPFARAIAYAHIRQLIPGGEMRKWAHFAPALASTAGCRLRSPRFLAKITAEFGVCDCPDTMPFFFIFFLTCAEIYVKL